MSAFRRKWTLGNDRYRPKAATPSQSDSASSPSLHRGPEMLPLLLLLGHEISESRVAPKGIEISVLFEERVARKAVVRGLAQVLKRQPRLVHPRVRRCDDVLGVMKLRITFVFLEC